MPNVDEEIARLEYLAKAKLEEGIRQKINSLRRELTKLSQDRKRLYKEWRKHLEATK